MIRVVQISKQMFSWKYNLFLYWLRHPDILSFSLLCSMRKCSHFMFSLGISCVKMAKTEHILCKEILIEPGLKYDFLEEFFSDFSD